MRRGSAEKTARGYPVFGFFYTKYRRTSKQGSRIVVGRLDRQTRWLQIRFEPIRSLDQDQTLPAGFIRDRRIHPAWWRTEISRRLLVGVHENGKLKFDGRVGTGFSEKLLKTLSIELNKIAAKACPFFNLPATGRGLDPGLAVAEIKRCIWVNPSMVCEVKFTEWT
jgi:hypothetical protein